MVPGRDLRLACDRWQPERGEHRGTVVLLHGGGQTRHSWRRTADRLVGLGWTVLAYDARGHGDSDRAPNGDYGLDAIVDDLSAVVDGTGVDPVLVRASLGGHTALAALGREPVIAAGLVLVDVIPRIDHAGRARIVRFIGGAPDGFGSREQVAEAVVAYNPHRPRPRNLDGLRKNVRRHDDGRWYWHGDPRFLDGAATRDDEHRLVEAARSLQVPTMLVRGAGSDVVTDDGVEHLRSLVGHVRVETVPAGHMIAGDDNDVFTTHLADFLDATEQQR